ncbi:hypothetical protein QOZ80_7AG0553820 [Eleusine coracana subsp. coracana]|nr:hypothetical protein QOZ80_7AG0553820 [Eleusine coracana subsp. coracana]
MADMVSSAVVQETVGQVLSGMVRKYEENEEPSAKRNLEMLEMAYIRLQAAIETSNKWQITDAPLLRWQRKLKRAAQECDITLQKCKQRILEDEQKEQGVRNLPFPKRVAHATKSFIFSFSRNNNLPLTSIVRRFEWFADGASEFLRFIELGGTPRHLMPFDSLVRHLLKGRKLQQKIVRGNECPLFLLLTPSNYTEYGVEASLNFIQKDSDAPEGNFYFVVNLQISESTDIIGIAVKCLQLFPTHLKSVTEIIRKNITQLPTLDFSWVPCDDSREVEHWYNIISLRTQWFRPDPLCCKQHSQHKFHQTSSLNREEFPDYVSLESIIEVNRVCQISCSKYNKKRTLLSEPKSSQQDSPHLQVALVYMPHGSLEDVLPVDTSSAVAEIHGKDKHWLHTDITFEELNETMLPKAKNYFHHNIEAAIYQKIWRPKHGAAFIQIKKAITEKPSARRTLQGSRKTELVQVEDEDLGFLVHIVVQFLSSWVAHAPTALQGLILYWVQKEMKSQLQNQRYT